MDLTMTVVLVNKRNTYLVSRSSQNPLLTLLGRQPTSNNEIESDTTPQIRQIARGERLCTSFRPFKQTVLYQRGQGIWNRDYTCHHKKLSYNPSQCSAAFDQRFLDTFSNSTNRIHVPSDKPAKSFIHGGCESSFHRMDRSDESVRRQPSGCWGTSAANTEA